MAGSLIEFQVQGLDEAQSGLQAIADAASDLQGFWTDVFAPRYLSIVDDYFATGGRPRDKGGRWSGGAWAQLSPRYRVWKSTHYPGRPILVREGRLRDSLQWTGSGVGPDGVFEATPTSVVIGSMVPYASFHQYGTSRMPARPFLPQPDMSVFGPLLQEWLMQQAKKDR